MPNEFHGSTSVPRASRGWARLVGAAAERWRLEMDNRWELAELGFTAAKLAPGDRIVVIANPARGESRRGYVRRLDRPADGFRYQHHD